MIRVLADSYEPITSPPPQHNLPSDNATISDTISKALSDFPHKKQKTSRQAQRPIQMKY